MNSARHGNEHGAVLAFVLMSIAILSVLGTALAALARVDTMQQNAEETTSKSFLVAEAGVNRGIGEFRNIFLDSRVPTRADFAMRHFDLSGLGVDYQLTEVPGSPQQITLPAGDTFAGLYSEQYRYTVDSSSYGRGSEPQARLSGEFDVSQVPIFQFLAFYTQDLAFSIPPTMNLHGRLHSNGDLYLNAASGNALRIEDLRPQVPIVQVSAAGKIFRGDPQNQSCSGDVYVDALTDADGDGSYDPLVVPCVGGLHEMSKEELAPWAGSLQRDVKNVTPPSVDDIVRGSGKFWQRADLRIVLDLSAAPERLPGAPLDAPLLHPIVVEDAAGNVDVTKTARLHAFMQSNPGKIFYNDVPNCADKDYACALLPASYTPAFASSAYVYREADDAGLDPQWSSDKGAYDDRRGGFFNNREKESGRPGKWMALLNIDLQALLDWNRAAHAKNLFDPDDDTDGGIVLFATVVGPLSDKINDYGVRIFDSAALGFPPNVVDPTGITVVSDQAIYVEGDFNTVNKAPASFIGDSLNVLSQNWEIPASGVPNDARSALAYTARPAANTTINAAMLAGIDPMSAAVSNGGFNNYPRFQEDWGGGKIDLVYRGSMVSLGTPKHVNGPFCGSGPTCDIYMPPARKWDYDPDFDDPKNLPPLTPSVVWVQQTVFAGDFK